jgi:hypothetical protein
LREVEVAVGEKAVVGACELCDVGLESAVLVTEVMLAWLGIWPLGWVSDLYLLTGGGTAMFVIGIELLSAIVDVEGG